MPWTSYFSRYSEKQALEPTLENSKQGEIGQIFQNLKISEGERILVSDTTVKNGTSALRKMRGLPSRGWKPFEEESKFNVAEPTHSRNNMKRAARKRSPKPEWSYVGIVGYMKAWFCFRSEQSQICLDPLSSKGQSDAVPIHTTSVSRYQPLLLPVNGRGAAARQSAAARNSMLLQCPAYDETEISPKHLPSYQKEDPRPLVLGQSLTQNVESGVNLDTFQHSMHRSANMNSTIRKGK